MGAPDDTTPAALDVERPAPAPRGERWMVRGDSGRSAAPTWEVLCGEGYGAADRAVEEMRRRFTGGVGARVEVHTEKGCGHLHLRILLVQDHHGFWEPFISPLSAPPPALPVVALLLRQTLAAAPSAPAVTSKGGSA